MAGENVARYTKATSVEDEALTEAKEVIDRFQRVATQLRNWQKVTFCWHKEDGTYVGLLPRERDENTITIEDVPTLHQVREAIDKWRNANGELHAAWNGLALDEREVMKKPAR